MARKRWPKGTWMKLKSAEVLRAFMSQKRFSVQRLATYSGCSKSMVGHLLSGYKTSCTVDLAQRLSEALDVPLEVLFEPRASAVSGSNDKSKVAA
jgi:transcriptional regulator with XRE-family HTH domain